jgi:hypothetical protein
MAFKETSLTKVFSTGFPATPVETHLVPKSFSTVNREKLFCFIFTLRPQTAAVANTGRWPLSIQFFHFNSVGSIPFNSQLIIYCRFLQCALRSYFFCNWPALIFFFQKMHFFLWPAAAMKCHMLRRLILILRKAPK